MLWDLLGRVHHRDIREVTVDQFARRYHVDPVQSQRVGTLARDLYRQLEPVRDEKDARAEAFLEWAARLHEIGITIAQGAYHKHTAYILANADMPGFSRQEQGWLSNLVLAQRGRLSKMREAFEDDASLATAALCLRLAVIFYRSRRTLRLPPLRIERKAKGFRLEVDREWLAKNTLVAIALEAERERVGVRGARLRVVRGLLGARGPYSVAGSGGARRPRAVSQTPARMRAMPARWNASKRSPRKCHASRLPNAGIRWMKMPATFEPTSATARFQNT